MSWCGEGLGWQLSSHLTRPTRIMKQQLIFSRTAYHSLLIAVFPTSGTLNFVTQMNNETGKCFLFSPSVTVTILTSVLRKISGFFKSYALPNSYEAKSQHSGLYFCCSSIKTSFTLHILNTMDPVQSFKLEKG